LIVTALPLDTPGVTITNTTENSVLTWSAVDGATSYIIDRYEYPGNWYFYTEVTDLTLTYIHQAPFGDGSFTTLRVCSKSGSVTSPYTGELKAYTVPYTPINVTASTDQINKIVLTWSIPAGGIGKNYKYRVYADDSATGAFTYACMGTDIYNTTALTCTITEFSPNVNKYFKVVAVNSAATVESQKSDAISGKEVSDTTLPTATITSVNGIPYTAYMSFTKNTNITISYTITDNTSSATYCGFMMNAGQSVNMSGLWSENPSMGSTRTLPFNGSATFKPPVTGNWNIEIMWKDASNNYARPKLYFNITN